MQFIIRVDASRWIGSGHVMRCLVLADGLTAAGHQVTFVCRPQAGDFIDVITMRGHQLICLPALAAITTPAYNADYASWLQVPWQQDAAELLASVTQANWLVVDHYGINAQWELQVKQVLNCKLLAIDDLVRPHAAELILDQTLDRQENEYLDIPTILGIQPTVLSGLKYALLSPQFSQVRKLKLPRAAITDPYKILLTFGGIDEPNVTLRALKVLSDLDALFTVLLSPRAPHYHEVKAWCDSQKNVVHHDFVQDMARLMSEHDIAIGAPGTTSWERACLGIPNVVIPIAENQQAICQALLTHQAALLVEPSAIERELLPAVLHLLNNHHIFAKANLLLCDGKGLQRVIQAIMAKTEISAIRLRPVTIDDAALIYQWQADPVTRRYALNPNIPSWEEHLAWIGKKLHRAQDYFFLIVSAQNGEPCGAVRLDELSVNEYLISIFISPAQHGKGIGLIGLKLIDECLPGIHIHATVLPENIASQRLFTKAGYQQVAPDKFIREPL
ncbi:UDP-2,4-diacetamido-2,4,6-trideoxy-beta-L-altropyranose hydrolase [Shewanella mangrovisoli]|uniref:UDP-2,4-diacetamido-2,4, 6-trideoxy-beta-L-altropyranose hydrolase n=1 Tax=Shewanella mangrovisoli TaxID=2864211 RepID=UPI0035BAE61F